MIKTSHFYSCFLLLVFLMLQSGCRKEREESACGNKPIDSTYYYPNSGRPGSILTLEGEDLDAGGDFTVEFASVKAEIISRGSRQILVRVPQGEGKVAVFLVQGAKRTAIGDFTYQSLSVTAIEPNYAIKGKQLKVIGAGFTSGTQLPKVFLNDSIAKIVSVTDTVMYIEVMGGQGRGPVKVISGNQESLGPQFQFLRYLDMKPKSGGPGSIVEIKIDGLSYIKGNVQVNFSGPYGQFFNCPVQSQTDSTILVKLPENIVSGPTYVLDTKSDSKLDGGNFTVVPPPKIFSISPASAFEGQEVLIEGGYFSRIPGETKVYIDTVLMPIKRIDESKIAIQIHKPIRSGLVRIEVNGQKVTGPLFTYQKLGITKISPENGIPGNEVDIEGFGFSLTSAENRVLFNGVPADVIQSSAGKLRVRVPNGVSSGPVTVQTNTLSATSSEPFNYAYSTSLGRGSLRLGANGGSMAVDNQGNVYVLEVDHHCIKKIAPDGTVSHFAGSPNGQTGLKNGKGTEILFNFDKNSTIGYDKPRNVIAITEPQHLSYRQLTLDAVSSSWSTPKPLETISFYPPTAYYPQGLVFYNLSGNNNNLYALMTYDNGDGTYFYEFFSFPTIKISNAYPNMRFAIDQFGNIYGQGLNFAFNKCVITKYVNQEPNFPAFVGGTFPNFAGNSTQSGYKDGIGAAALFNNIKGITILDEQHCVVLDAGNFALRRVNNDNAEVTTIFKNDAGYTDGDLRHTKISNNVSDIAVSADGRFCYILDNGNSCVRKIQLR